MTSTDPRTGARVSSEAVTPAFPPVSFADLVATVPGATIRGDAAVPLTDVAFDSREVASGALFFCVPGRHVDGHAFAPQARDAGAAALVVERWLDMDAPQALVPSVRRAMGPMSSSAFGDPAASMATVGVTGTNGKTTVTYILASIFRAAGRTAGVVGTTGASIDGRPVPVARTTPEAPDLHRLLARMRDEGVQAAALEVSSHALDQHRVDGIVFDVAIFTNLSQDHLDFHANMEAYFEAKARLFTPEHARRAVVNADDPSGRRLADGLVIAATTFGVDPGADVRGEDVAVTPEGIAFTVGGLKVRSRLRGAFNVGNVLAAVAAARALGIDDDPIRDGIGALDDVPGRMEPVEAGQDFLVVVDYAHTPDSIRSVLRASRPLTSGRLILVFGCGGDRDRAKRSPMGAAATADADLTFITTDNPRSEDPLAIIAEIEPGAKEGGGSFVIEPDRRAAIRLALREAAPGDVVIVAGKGHEPVQELRDADDPVRRPRRRARGARRAGRGRMKPRRMSDVARAVEGLFLGQDVEVTSVAIDSRDVVPGGLFVALPGERTDGGRFVPEAFANGAAGALVRDGLDVDGPAVSVRSTGEALMMLARDERSRMDANVIAVTGANGKTSTKDMAGAVLATRFRTHASRESLNNEVGLPMTLLGAPPDTQVVVAEMGARHVGDVAILCGIARPDIAIVTNVGVAHLEVFGSWDRIVEASAEPVEALGPDGVAILNADDAIVAGYAGRTSARVVTFGLAPDADVRAVDVSLGSDGRASFMLVSASERVPVTLAVPGEHMVSNALAAAATGVTLGVSLACRRGGAVAGGRVAVAHGDVHHAGGRADRQRRVQREPRVDGGRVAGRTVDGGGGAPHRGARHHGRARSDRGQGA